MATKGLSHNASRAEVQLRNMTYRSLKKACVSRGMDFDSVINGDYCKLASFFSHKLDQDEDPTLLDQYDEWLEGHLKERGLSEPYFHPSFRLGYIGERDTEQPKLKTKKVKKTKKKKTKTKDGLYSGTKKSLTYELQRAGRTKEETLKEVMERFPDASKKSIGIWYNKARKEAKKAED